MLNKIKSILQKSRPKITPETQFHSLHYQRHNHRRLEHLATLGLPIAGCRVLEVGAGIGDHTGFFIDRGCEVTTSDARPENIEYLRWRYPNLRVMHLDLDDPPRVFNESFDIVYCYGVLYHLKNPIDAIQFMARSCKQMLLLETCVSFGMEDSLNPCNEDAENPTQAISGRGCRPTRPWVYNRLKQHFEFVYITRTQPWHEEFPIDWTVHPPPGLTRSVFVASRTAIASPLLTEEIPLRQVRC